MSQNYSLKKKKLNFITTLTTDIENIEEPYARNNGGIFLHFCKSLKVNKSFLVLINVNCLVYFYLKRKFTVFFGFTFFLETIILYSNLCFRQKKKKTNKIIITFLEEFFFWGGEGLMNSK